MEACLDRGHSEQLGQLSGSAAGRLISPAQFFTPYFINKKAVKKTHRGRSSAPSTIWSRLSFSNPAVIKTFLGSLWLVPRVQMWSESSDALLIKELSRLHQTEKTYRLLATAGQAGVTANIIYLFTVIYLSLHSHMSTGQCRIAACSSLLL